VCLNVGRQTGKVEARALPPAPRWPRPDPSWLLTREREFPNDAPTWTEMALWFMCGLAALGGASVIVLAIARFVKRSTFLFFPVAMLLGFLGPNVFSALVDQTLFTWPVSLYAAFHAALYACCWAEIQEGKTPPRLLTQLVVVGFLLTGWGYYEMCKSVGMFIAWSFLIGFPCAFPLTLLAVRAALLQQPRWRVAAWTLLAFAAFFWSAQGLLLWKAAEST
jgi:hypothetical protein